VASGGLDNCLWRNSGCCAGARLKQLDGLSRELPSARLWALVLAAVPDCARGNPEFHGCRAPGNRPSHRAFFFWPALRGELFAAFLSHARLCGIRKGRRRRRLLLCCQCVAGRLLGITLSGTLYQFGGMTGCFVGSAVMLLLCTLITFLLPTEESLSEVREHRPQRNTLGAA
jgi:hypothetical protein